MQCPALDIPGRVHVPIMRGLAFGASPDAIRQLQISIDPATGTRLAGWLEPANLQNGLAIPLGFVLAEVEHGAPGDIRNVLR